MAESNGNKANLSPAEAGAGLSLAIRLTSVIVEAELINGIGSYRKHEELGFSSAN